MAKKAKKNLHSAYMNRISATEIRQGVGKLLEKLVAGARLLEKVHLYAEPFPLVA